MEHVNGAKLYLHVFNWPEDGKLLVPGLRNKVAQAYLLADPKRSLEAVPFENGVLIRVDDAPLDPIATVIVLKVQGRLEIDEVLPGQDEDGVIVLKAQDADIHNVLGGEFDVLDTIKETVVVGTIKDPLSRWADPQVCVEWSFENSKAGTFEIFADLSVEEGEARFELSVSGHKEAVAVPSTGGVDRMKRVRLGEITLSNAGPHHLRICPDQESWSAVHLKSIALQPVLKENMTLERKVLYAG